MPVRIVVKLEPLTARRLQADAGGEAAALPDGDASVRLTPLHPGSDDPSLAGYFITEAPDAAAARWLIERLLRSGSVEAAYVKPPDEMP